MSYTRKSLEDLNVLDDFLINAVASDPEVGIPFCRTLLSVLLQREIGEIHVIAQRTIPALTPNMRGIRMDVEIEELTHDTDYDNKSMHVPETTLQNSGLSTSDKKIPYICNVYDIEPHTQNNINLPKHNRFYQAKIDSRYMHSGDKSFDKMPDLYMLTITNYDPFGYDYMMYTVRNQCVEVPSMNYRDGVHMIYFNTKGTKGGCKDIRSMLKYLQTSTQSNATDAATQTIHDYVSSVKLQPEVRLEYMKFDDIIYFAQRDAEKEAILSTRIQDIYELLEDYGDIPEALKDYLNTQTDVNILSKWHKLAAHAASMEDFMEQIGCTITV